MNPTFFGVLGPGFLNQVPTLVGTTLSGPVCMDGVSGLKELEERTLIEFRMPLSPPVPRMGPAPKGGNQSNMNTSATETMKRSTALSCLERMKKAKDVRARRGHPIT